MLPLGRHLYGALVSDSPVSEELIRWALAALEQEEGEDYEHWRQQLRAALGGGELEDDVLAFLIMWQASSLRIEGP